jgi:hypothetical protein
MKCWRYLFALLLAALFLGACGVSEIEQQSEISDQADSTATPEPTAMPTITKIPEPTMTPTLTATPDIRVVDASPELFILSMDELLLREDSYVEWTGEDPNSEQIIYMTEDEANAFLEGTERVSGWGTVYYSELWGFPMNVNFWAEISRSAVGTDYSVKRGGCYGLEGDPVIAKLDFLEGGRICYVTWEYPPGSGVMDFQYWTVISYRNVKVVIFVYPDQEIPDIEWLIDIARRQLMKLQGLPLNNTVTWSP